MNAQTYQRAVAKIQAKARAQIATIALCEGRVVVSHHPDCVEANKALCRKLDEFFEANPEASRHDFDMVALRVATPVGQPYSPLDVVHGL